MEQLVEITRANGGSHYNWMKKLKRPDLTVGRGYQWGLCAAGWPKQPKITPDVVYLAPEKKNWGTIGVWWKKFENERDIDLLRQQCIESGALFWWENTETKPPRDWMLRTKLPYQQATTSINLFPCPYSVTRQEFLEHWNEILPSDRQWEYYNQRYALLYPKMWWKNQQMINKKVEAE